MKERKKRDFFFYKGLWRMCEGQGRICEGLGRSFDGLGDNSKRVYGEFVKELCRDQGGLSWGSWGRGVKDGVGFRVPSNVMILYQRKAVDRILIEPVFESTLPEYFILPETPSLLALSAVMLHTHASLPRLD